MLFLLFSAASNINYSQQSKKKPPKPSQKYKYWGCLPWSAERTSNSFSQPHHKNMNTNSENKISWYYWGRNAECLVLRPRALHTLRAVHLQSLNQHLSRSPSAWVGLGSLLLTPPCQPGWANRGGAAQSLSVHLGCHQDSLYWTLSGEVRCHLGQQEIVQNFPLSRSWCLLGAVCLSVHASLNLSVCIQTCSNICLLLQGKCSPSCQHVQLPKQGSLMEMLTAH